MNEYELGLNLSLIRLLSPKLWDEKFKCNLENTDRITTLLSVYNYTDNWNMLMPLIEKYGIYYAKHCDGFTTCYDVLCDDMIICEADTLQIALAACLLKVLEQ